MLLLIGVENGSCELILLALAGVEDVSCEVNVLALDGVEKTCWDVKVLLFKQEQAEETRASVGLKHCVAYGGSPSTSAASDFVKVEQKAAPLP
jgi:hypothetical protein